MDNQIIEDIATGFSDQLNLISKHHGPNVEAWAAQCRDDIIMMAKVIHKHRPEYDIHQFYMRAGYGPGHPSH